MTTTSGMKFHSMNITREEYGPHKDKLSCKVRCNHWNTQLEVQVPDDVANDIMRMLASTIAAQVQIALTDVARDHENWMLSQDAGQIEAIAEDAE